MTIQLNETKVQYSRQARLWLTYPGEISEIEAICTGKVEIFPAGVEGRRAALLSALTNDAPAVAAECEVLIRSVAAPGWIDRVIRAGFIVKNGDVLLAPFENYVTVRSQNPKKRLSEYLVQRRVTGWMCQCGDWQNGREARFYDRPAGAPTVRELGTMCKHAIAVLVAVKLGLVPEKAL